MDRIYEETDMLRYDQRTHFRKPTGLTIYLCPLEARDREKTTTSAPRRMVLVLKPFPSARRLESNLIQAAKRRSWPREKVAYAQLQMPAKKRPTKECDGNHVETKKSLQMALKQRIKTPISEVVR